MQEAVDTFMQGVVRAERGDPSPVEDEDFGLHYPYEYVCLTWLHHRTHGGYPRAGGLDDQDEQLMQDWHALNLRYAWHAQQTGRAFRAPTTAQEW